MLSALLLSALVLGPPAGVPARAAASQDDPAIRLWLSDDGRYRRGDQANVQVKTRDDGYLLVLNVDPDGRLRVLFPLDPGDDNFIRGGRKYEIVGRGGRKGFEVSNRSGQGTVYAAVSRAPFRFSGYVTNDHWDLGALDDVRMSDKPEGDLNQFVQQLATTDFDYDVLGYSIYERVVYGGPVYDDYAYDYSPYDYYPWGYGGTSLFIGLSFGHHHRFYDPFFYSPFYYPTYYYYPAYYYPTYYYPYYPVFHHPRPYYPYAYYPGRPSYGGYFATPWRRRVNDPLAPGGFQWWRGRDATFGTSATLAGYRTGFGRIPFTPARAPTATPVRGTVATTDAGTIRRRSLDMTPARIEGTGTRGAIQPGERTRAPVGRRAVEHNETWAGRVPERVGRRGNEAPTPAARPRDVSRPPEARPSRSSEGITRNRDEVAPVRDRSGYEGQRVIQSQPQARRAEDSRPASRPNIESRPMDRPSPGRIEPSEPAPRMERSEPAPRMGRSEPAPRMERSEPAPRMERSEPAPRQRSEPAPRMEHSGGGGGGGAERGGGGGANHGDGWGGRRQ
jgi:hypothetical protein